MTTQRTEIVSHDHRKRWNLIFLTERNFSEDQPWVQSMQITLADGNLEADGDNLDRFMEEYEGEVPSCRSEEVKEFCHDTSLMSLQPEVTGGKPDKAKAWLNDRAHSTQDSRDYPRRLTAYQLYTLLMKKV